MNLSRFPRRRYTEGWTPMEQLGRLSALVNGPEIWIKRDDLLGLFPGGNKTRKLEFVMADALAKGADSVITCGAVQSNHCRITLAAARKEGLECHLVIEERVPGSYSPTASGNNFLYHLMGADSIRVVPAKSDMIAEMEKTADELRRAGKKPYIIPGGASNPLGAIGYVACAEEILAQSFEKGVSFDRIFVTSGSGGTHAGLAVGLWGNRSGIPLTGINISRPNSQQVPLVHSLATETARYLGIEESLPEDLIQCFDEYVGEGYSLPTEAMTKTVALLARTESILLDPVYTGKAFAGMLDLIQKGFCRKGEKVLFIHTGGFPALFHYQKYFDSELFQK
ncbi:D-cysteine desulfhydrase [Acetomicrobium sp. S15 = DSM 107314]|jgi:D-cysteine desulfhydrase|uniref:D-cysteine desulfhydrase n=1 Tax=Acetomicrobium sp. S15 = DSM 107314 TaxID=2529858 RepID=UPI0018E10832|nr:D-cysteine desulfhydrase [Acetomicrobium sp. S15 = DSM 107314]